MVTTMAPLRTHWVRLLLVILVAGLLATPTAQAAPDRHERYADNLETILYLQNGDGGFGDLGWTDNGTRQTTEPTRASYLETVLTVHLLLREGHAPLDVHENWEGATTSLAASNAPNALDWLRQFEARHGQMLTPGELGLVSVAYSGLGDDANTERVLTGLIEEADGTYSTTDHAQIVFAVEHLDLRFDNRTLNDTYGMMAAGLTDANTTGVRDTAWALLAQPHDDERRMQLVAALDSTDGGAGKESRGLAAWALAESGGADAATEAAVEAVYDRAPFGLARVLAMEAERTAWPWVSPLVPSDSATVGLDVGAGTGDRSGVAADDYEHIVAENERLKEELATRGADDGPTFPIPTWLMVVLILSSLAALSVVSLAYGLKKEDLAGPRKLVFEYIEKNPGEHFSKIRRETGLAAGTFQHHLSVLESEGWITSYKDARYKRYFVNGNRYQTLIKGRSPKEYKTKFSALKNATSRDLVHFVRTNPGATQKQVAARLNLHASTVNWHAKRLHDAGLLERERVGKEVHYRVDDDSVDKILRP